MQAFQSCVQVLGHEPLFQELGTRFDEAELR